ncbi:NAD+ synthase [candidate division WOR-3 bacterium]|nr:NAD+ synthase [candidate division WOR-3 bacterium]
MWENVIHKIVQWLKDELNKTKTKGFVLGISGGLDSSVCAALIKKATEECLGLILPIESNIQDLDDAAEVASQINLKTQYIDLTPIYRNLIKFLPDNNQVALGNIKARLRMVVIYYYANLNNYLVCGTGNKTEISLGYFTKHGDGACDILPLGDLYKFEVREIARVLGIPEQIIKKVPSAGLWQGQTDEGEIGFSYDVIDETLQEIEKNQIKGDVAKKLKFRIEQSEHKRKLPKICYLKK